MKRLVLFGAGVYAKKYQALFEFLDIDFDYFTDNDKSIHGKLVLGKEVISPECLIDLECNILISCTHTKAIKEQLCAMGISDKLIDVSYFYKLFEKKAILDHRQKGFQNKQQQTVIMDMYEGVGWGGTEIWVAQVTKGLALRNYQTLILGSNAQVTLNEEYERYVERFSLLGAIEQLAKKIENHLPCTVINNFAGSVLLAAIFVKMRYPDDIKIISVIHNDNESLYEDHFLFREYIDRVVCVSGKIRENIIEKYSISPEKVYFKEQPIEIPKDFLKQYAKESEPIRIGYAGRIVKQQKRADLLPKVIEELERKNINYRLEIAGEGNCLKDIETYLTEKNLRHKILIRGRIDKCNMPDFWKDQDVFINFSEYEGTSLSMLEAMSYGCVPIVTDVSGAREFIVHGKNGYICEIGDIKGLVNHIAYLDENRKLLVEYGMTCKNIIQERCEKEGYLTYIEKVIRECW